ncbi:hypothetical protein ACQRIT_003371 [Beauveria bassiana]
MVASFLPGHKEPATLYSDSDEECQSSLLQTDEKRTAKFPPAWRSWNFWSFKLVTGLLALNAALMGFLLYQSSRRGPSNPIFPQMSYSPAEDILEYEARVFITGFEKGEATSVYVQEPSEKVDKAWKDLYDVVGISRIPRSSAEKLPNGTYPFTNDPGYYIVSLAVFHQLHCLNKIRQALHPEYYHKKYPPTEFGDKGALGKVHIDHCLESLRQSITCASDVSPIIWKWHEDKGRAMEEAAVPHTCRKFDAVYAWANANKAITSFLPEVRDKEREL